MESKNKKLTPAELIKIHLKDSSHVITDEELLRVKVGVDGDTELESKVFIKEEELSNQFNKDAPVPYNLLDF